MPTIEARGITLLGLSVSNLERAGSPGQLTLPLERRSAAALDTVLDAVRDRFGPDAVTRAVLLGRGGRAIPWLMPDE
jgi:DNA polymerase IV